MNINFLGTYWNLITSLGVILAYIEDDDATVTCKKDVHQFIIVCKAEKDAHNLIDISEKLTKLDYDCQNNISAHLHT